MIDGILESSLSVTINYNLLCIRVDGFRNLLSREDLQWVSRVCCLLCAGR